MVTKDLGMVTAYAYAVAGGYTGTEAEFTQLMADLAVVVDDFDNFSVNVTTLPAGSSATASYADGVLSLGIPKGDKGDKGNTGETGAPAGFGTVSATVDASIGTPSVVVTASGADTAKNFAFAFHNLKGQKGDKGDTGDVTLSQLEDFTVVQTDENVEPYNFRATPKCGHIERLKKVVGVSVAYNQLCNGSSVTVQSGHKYFLKKGGAESVATSTGSAITGLTSGSDMVVDLTLALGSTIADYVYSLEQANAGAGVAWFKKYFPKPYYAYNAGQLMSVKALRHITRGFNAWDEEWESGTFDTTTGNPINTGQAANQIRSKNLISVVSNASYYINTPNGIWCIFYDADMNVITPPVYDGNVIASNGKSLLLGDTIRPASITFTMFANARYMKFYCQNAYGNTYNHDICINLSWDGERDGEYEEYVEHIYELDSDLELRGIPKLTAGNDLYYDGDVYEPDGTVTRKYGIVDLGTLTWNMGTDNQFFARINGLKYQTDDGIAVNVICPKYTTVSKSYYTINSTIQKLVRSDNATDILYFRDSEYSSSADFKTAMSGVYLVYELATPTTETADPYTENQICEAGGTEEFVSTSIVPIGHETEYPLTLSDIRPTANGNYVLKCTVTNGKASYEWVSA